MKVFFTRSGAEVLVGRNAKENDHLTFVLSQKDHLWLHASDVPGSHVVIKATHPSDDDILDAADLAAKYSKAATGEGGRRSRVAVAVTVCLVMDVEKPRFASAGSVFTSNTRIVFGHL